ncbi:MAG: hypothetical protein V4538_15460, partial [Bacteroidota bacterium]
MKQTFEDLKNKIIELASNHTGDSCSAFRRVKTVKDEAELLLCIYDNLQWCINHKVISNEYFLGFDQDLYIKSGIANTGKENTGLVNSGYRNSGDSNSGYRNSGDSNSGDSNSGDRNSGDSNSGDRNSGDSNSGYRNSGSWN